MQDVPLLTPNLVTYKYTGNDSVLDCCGYKRLQELYIKALNLHANELWEESVWRSTQLRTLHKLHLNVALDGLTGSFFPRMVACLQEMQDLRDVNIAPYEIYDLEKKGLDIFTPFSSLTRFDLTGFVLLYP